MEQVMAQVRQRNAGITARFALTGVIAAGLVACGGCARDSGEGLSYVGLADLGPAAAEAADADVTFPPSTASRHIQSNKVLGAMAYQKVTGRTIDPSRLSGSR